MSPKRPTGPAAGRKGPPPEATGLEAAWFEAQAEAGNAVAVRLDDGTTLRGTVVAYRQGLIELRPEGDAKDTVTIRVERIRLVEGP